jgi:hypothetical protein
MIKTKWLCWNCEKWTVGIVNTDSILIKEGEPTSLLGDCVNCGEKSEILLAVSSGKCE